MNIDTIHGVVQEANSQLFVHRNLLDAGLFSNYLRSRPAKYVPLRQALEGAGEALTIDDSISAGAEAARLARKYGHAVTIFLNGYNIEYGKPYFFSRLNVALDTKTVDEVEFKSTVFDLRDLPSIEKFRCAVKQGLAVMGSENKRQDFVTEIASLLQAREPTVPRYLAPMTHAEVRDLVDLDVDIQNHGWTHARVEGMTPARHALDIRKGRKWIDENCGLKAPYFAVPNGDGLPPSSGCSECAEWFLLTESLPEGRIRPGVVNRKTLILS